MINQLDTLFEEVRTFESNDEKAIEAKRIEWLGKKGSVTALFTEFRNVPAEEKKVFGQRLNELKTEAIAKIQSLKEASEPVQSNSTENDYTRPVAEGHIGSRHPLSIVRNQIIEIFGRIGFNLSEGPIVEDDWHNFSALNFPPEHPARDMQDTFFVEGGDQLALRTHTSSVQVRVMENEKPPIRTISPGRVFRNESITARAHCIFHQVEGLYIDKDVSFADLKQTLLYFARELFGPKTEIRLRPSYFPFTEPSAEVDVSCNICKGKGCNVCKYTGYVEIMGCGMVDPAVLQNCGIDPEEYSGFAFGMGIERITMLKYRVNDLRLFFENDLRFLEQFKSTLQ